MYNTYFLPQTIKTRWCLNISWKLSNGMQCPGFHNQWEERREWFSGGVLEQVSNSSAWGNRVSRTGPGPELLGTVDGSEEEAVIGHSWMVGPSHESAGRDVDLQSVSHWERGNNILPRNWCSRDVVGREIQGPWVAELQTIFKKISFSCCPAVSWRTF